MQTFNKLLISKQFYLLTNYSKQMKTAAVFHGFSLQHLVVATDVTPINVKASELR